MYQLILLTITLIILIVFLRSIPSFHYDDDLDIELFKNKETGDDMHRGCHDKIVKRGDHYYIFDSKSPLEVHKNPIVFNSLDDYANWERRKSLTGNYDCPILYYSGKDDKYVHPGERMITRDAAKAQDPLIVNGNQAEIIVDEYGTPIEKPYTREQIYSLDDYEYNRIFGDGERHSKKFQAKKDEKLNRLHNDPMVHHKKISYESEKAMIDPGNVNGRTVRLTPQEQILESQKVNLPAGEKAGDFNPLVENSPEEIKAMYLKQHPEIADCKVERNGYNSYTVVEVVPKREGGEGDLEATYQNRPDEKALIPEDIRNYGGTAADPKSQGLKYLSPLAGEEQYSDAVERMFAPSIPREVWYQSGEPAKF
jgi:hypothetical protein